MKNTKVTLFSLVMVAFLVACNHTPLKTYNITLINPEDTTMVTSNVKQYIHDMRMTSIRFGIYMVMKALISMKVVRKMKIEFILILVMSMVKTPL